MSSIKRRPPISRLRGVLAALRPSREMMSATGFGKSAALGAALSCFVLLGPGCSGSASSDASGDSTNAGTGGETASVGGEGGDANVGGESSLGGVGGTSSGPRAGLCANGDVDKPGFRVVRRLSQAEYNRTLKDVFGADPATWQDISFPGEITKRGAYENFADGLLVTEPMLAALVDKTFDRAQSLLSGPTGAQILVAPCTAGAIDATCADALVRKYAYRLFRRPVEEAEITEYVALYNKGVAELALTPDLALAGTLAALMQSPSTLYIEQLGQAEGSGPVALGPYEIASVLAYGLTGTAPSQDLLDRTATGAFATPDAVANEARALIQGPKGQEHLRRFFASWLQYDLVPYVSKDQTVYADFSPELAGDMVEESRLLLENTLGSGGGLAQLLLAPQTYVNLRLAQHYGYDTVGLTDDQFVERQRPAGHGLGLTGQGSFLTRMATSNSSSPTQRGVFILRNLMCKELGSPPPVVPEITPPTTEITTRERYENVHAVDGCVACHGRIDPIGFAFENFDGVGKYRTSEAGQPINATGSIKDMDGVTFDGPDQLLQALISDPQIHQCFAAQLSSFIYGVSVDDGLCIAPAATYASTTEGFETVIEQVAAAAHMTTRSQ
jgi:hypothetical protein